MHNNNSKHKTETFTLSKSKFSVVLVIVLSFVMALSTISCKKNNESTKTSSSESVRTDGAEEGMYYFDADGSDYLIEFDGSKNFKYVTSNSTKKGTYTVSGDTITMTFATATDGQMTASIAENTLTVTYNGAQMRFYKKGVEYTISFDTKGGSAIADVPVENGRTLEFPADPSYDGYVFAGWYTDSDYTTPVNPSIAITSNATYYARWFDATPGKPDYQITFKYLDGTTEDTTETTVGGKILSVATPTNGDFTFGGWWISDYEDATKLTRKYEDGMTFDENTTLFALWTKAEEGAKLNAPIVNVDTNGISWDSVGTGVIDYTITITGPDGNSESSTTSTSKAIDWANEPAGDYIITVKANATNIENDSNATTRYFKNKALARVSSFGVIDPATFIFDAVDNATDYYVSVTCGNANHAHGNYYLGSSTYYYFGNCAMIEGGITFVVIASADGYASSTSATYTYSRDLDAIEEIYFDESTQTLSWDRVANAASYVVTIACDNEDHNHTATNIGNANTYNLKECTGNITFGVYPVTAGYNSPAATEYVYNKTILASPANVKVNATTISWDAVEGAEYYSLMIGNVVLKDQIKGTSFDVLTAIDWIEGGSYKVSVKAVGATESAWSESVSMQYYTMYGTLTYNDGYVSWKPVIGAARYEINVNGNSAPAVSGGVTEYKVTFDRAGENIIEVRFIDGNNTPSAWASISVYAYEIEFDPRGGKATPSIYKAIGDTINELPTSTKAGYKLEGWYNAIGGPDGNAAKLNETDVFNANASLMYYAYWEANEIKVNFDLGNNCSWPDGEEDPEVYVLFNSSDFKLPVPVLENTKQVFIGWSTIANDQDSLVTNDLGEAVEGYKWNFSEETTLYACCVTDVFKFTALSDGTYSVKKGSNARKVTTLTVPTEYEGTKVTVVEGLAFKDLYYVKTIKIPDTIELIESATAFSGCNRLESVEIYATGSTQEKFYASEDGIVIRLRDDEHAIYSNRIDFVPVAKKGALTIPDTVGIIPYQSFNKSQLSEVYIPSSVTVVERGAFYDCVNLNTVKFLPAESEYADFLTVQDSAFIRCKALTSVTLPSRTQTLGFKEGTNELAIFEGCTALRAIHMEAGNAKYGSIDGVLTTSKDSVSPTNPYAIIYCPQARRGEYEVPSDITAIKPYAFYGCTNLTGVTIPGSVTEIGAYAFYGCSNVAYVDFNGTSISGTTISEYAFAKNTNLKSIIYGEDSRVTNINNNAFADCSSLKEVTIPKSIVSIGDEVFANGTSIGKVSFAEGGKKILFGERTFLNCKALTEVYIPSTIEEIPLGMFEGCISLKGVYVDDNNPYFMDDNGTVYSKGKDIIYYYSLLNGDITLPDTVTTIMGGVFKGNVRITKFTFGANISSIGSEAFANCTSLETVTFNTGDNALSIGSNVFSDCYMLNNVTIPAGVTEIADGMFRSDSKLNTIVLHNGITKIGDYAFYGTRISIETLPSDLVYIGDYALAYTGVYKAELSTEFTHLGKYAFFNCASLTKFDIPEGGKLTAIPEGCFKGTSIVEFYVPKAVTYIGAYAFEEVKTLTKLEFEQGDGEDLVIATKEALTDDNSYGYYTENESFAFGHTSITELKLPERLTILGDGAFIHCTQLKFVDFGENSRLKVIGGEAFGWCTALLGAGIDEDFMSEQDYIDNGMEDETGYPYEYFYYLPLTLPANLQDMGPFAPAIGECAFYNCYNVKRIKFLSAEEGYTPEGKLSICKDAFGCIEEAIGVGENYEVVLPANFEFMWRTNESNDLSNYIAYHFPFTYSIAGSDNANFYCENGAFYSGDRKTLYYVNTTAGTFTIPKEVTHIGKYAIQGSCTGIAFEAGGTEPLQIAEYAFSKRTKKLTSLTFPTDRPVSISGYAFQNLDLLTSLYIPANVTDISSYAFGYGKFTSLTFENGDEDDRLSLNWYSFANCTKIESLELPDHLVAIGEGAFYYCTSLETVTFGEDSRLESIGNSTFSSTAVKEFVLPAGVKVLGRNALGAGVEKITLSDEISDITTALIYIDDYDTYKSANSANNVKEIIVPETNKYLKNGVKTVIEVDPETEDEVEKQVPDTGVVYSKDGKTLVYFARKADVTGFELSSTVENIGPMSMLGVKFDSMNIPANVKIIGRRAFYDSDIKTLTFESRTEALEIGDYAFYSNVISGELIIPATTTKIGDYAFYNCSGMTSVSFGQNSALEEIGSQAFKGTRITGVVIPNKVSSISDAFAGITTLTSVEFAPNNNSLSVIPDGAFKGCTKLTQIELPSGIISIGNEAFMSTGLTSINLGEFIVEIGRAAFSSSKLQSINIPGTVVKIMPGTFKNCTSLVSVTLNAGTEELLSVWDYYGLEYCDGAFEGCTALASIIIPDTVMTIDDLSFKGCSSLVEAQLSNGLTKIGAEAFSGCRNIESITLPNQVQVLSSKAFSGCANLVSVELPNGIQEIGDYAFENCVNLEEIVIPASVKVLGLNPFAGCTNFSGMKIDEGNDYYVIEDGILYNFEKTKIILFPVGYTGEYEMPNSVTEIAAGLFANSQLTKVTVATSITEIPENAFKGSKSLKEVVLHAGITKIGDYAFSGCTALKSLKSLEGNEIQNRLPSKLREIGVEAFSQMGLESIEISNTVTSIGEKAFYKSTALKTVTFESNGVDQLTIPNYAFAETGITSIEIPFRVRTRNQGHMINSIPAIGDYAFAGCAKLKTVTVEKTGSSVGLEPYFRIGSYAFSGCSELVSVEFPSYLASDLFWEFDADTWTTYPNYAIGMSAFYQYKKSSTIVYGTCPKLTTVTFGEGNNNTVLISDNAFRETAITSIELPANTIGIGSSAFESCTSLTSVLLPYMLEPDYNYGSYYFRYCTALTTVTFRDYSASAKWTSIGNSMFYGCSALTNFKLPDSVNSIETKAFTGCNAITFEASENNAWFTTGEDGTLYNKGVTKVILYAAGSMAGTYTLPATVTSHDTNAFTVTPNLKEIIVEQGNTAYSINASGNLMKGTSTTPVWTKPSA